MPMLIPHLHLGGRCREAINLYEKAFDTKAGVVIPAADGGIGHAAMTIHGQTVYLNDRFGRKDRQTDAAIHLIVTFNDEEALLACYQVLQHASTLIDPLQALAYTRLAVQFIDCFGVQWGFMVEDEHEA